MFPPIQFGRIFGIPLQARVSFLVMLAAVLLFMGGLAGVFVVLLAFGSVIVHELGHALVARKLGVGVSGIELHFFGGVAKLTSQPQSNRDEALIAGAGPAVSFALAGLGYLLFAVTGLGGFALLGGVNLIIALFNLLPALPMDGGRIFRALLSSSYGYRRATDIAIKLSRVVSIAFVVFGLAFMQLYFVLLAGVLWTMATAEQNMAHQETSKYGEGEVFPSPFTDADGLRMRYGRSGNRSPRDRVIIVRDSQRRN